ncbi:uncharacterized protein SAPINGB_P002610 [Magnusiomyces paraingens]|uniref:Ribosomal RNA-processing protein 8 n=1 Tax=Magnusiomyces paraingens TaxID=2606893 RepID=A0A5E8BF35_9ASCO|nr:uncharacterized protein SAPINGB_P002610 [Saprochaete ingens]VVT50119.1 unnamed protein product [Saprochaete ingens]
MSIFKVEGWDLPQTIAVATSKDKQRRDQKKKDKEQYELLKKLNQTEEKEEETPTDEPVQPEKKRKASVDEDGFTQVKSKKQKKNKKTEVKEEAQKPEEALVNEEKKNKATKEAAEAKEEAPVKKEKKDKKKKNKATEEPTKAKEESTTPATTVTAPLKMKLTPLQQKMLDKLSGSRFRWINEQLYTTTSEEAVKIIKEQPSMFDEYHAGFRSQVQSWPQNPVNEFVKQVIWRMQKPIGAPGGMPGERDGTITVADMGCGEANLALELAKYQSEAEREEKKRLRTKKFAKPGKLPKFVVHSFDLKKANERITVADIKNVPLEDESVNVVVFCLALMGTNFLDFIKEGLRILKPNGEIWIAEIKSRFADNDTKEFVSILKSLGLFHKSTDDSNKMFVRFEFFKPNRQYLQEREEKEKRLKSKRRTFEEADEEDETLAERRSKAPEGKWLLKPCLYKRR